MPDEIRVSRPSGQPQMRPDMQMQEQMAPAQGGSKMPWVVLALVVIVIIILAVLFRDKLTGSGAGKMTATTSSSSGYQGVFLTNGQVYFGKIANPDGDYVDLSDIFYLQVGPQQGSATAPGQTAATPQQQISLVKLGNELHGPVDEMHISRAQILFYEDLKSDGQVVTAIDRYKANPQGGSQPTTQPAPTK